MDVLRWQKKWPTMTTRIIMDVPFFSVSLTNHIVIKTKISLGTTCTCREDSITWKLIDLFHLHLLLQAFQELRQLHQSPSLADAKPIIGPWFIDSSVRAFLFCLKSISDFNGQPKLPATFKWLWHSCCQKEHNVFFWLILQNELDTRAMIQRTSFLLAIHLSCRDRVLETKKHFQRLQVHCGLLKHNEPQSLVF